MTMTKRGRGQAVPLTQSRVSKLKPNSEKILRVWSSNLAGFHVAIYPSGTKTYYLRYSAHNGKQKFVRIGDAAVLDFDDAVEEARQRKKELLAGSDPATNAARGWSPQTVTVEQAMEAVLTSKSVPLASCRTNYVWAWEASLGKYIVPVLGKRKLADIKGTELRPIINAIVADGKLGAAGLTLAHWGSLCKNIAYLPGLEDFVNPATGVRFALMKSPPRDRVLNPAELGEIWQGFSENVVHQTVIRFILLSGQRISQVLGTTWDQVDWEEGRISWTADQMKGKRKHVIPITDRLREVLMQTRGLSDTWVFPQWTGVRSKQLQYQQVAQAVWRFVDKHAMEKWSSHTLRHTLTSNAIGEAGANPTDVSALLHHQTGGVTMAVYMHSQPLPAMERAMLTYEDWLARKQVFGTELAEVVSIAR